MFPPSSSVLLEVLDDELEELALDCEAELSLDCDEYELLELDEFVDEDEDACASSTVELEDDELELAITLFPCQVFWLSSYALECLSLSSMAAHP